MFWNKKKSGTDHGVQAVTEFVSKKIADDYHLSLNVTKLLKMVTSANGEDSYIRIFDESDALARDLVVKSYQMLEEHPELVIFEGTYNEKNKKLSLIEKKKGHLDCKIFTEQEITEQIEALTKPGSTAFFYIAQGSGHGGPLGLGAAVVEFNPEFPGKGKKYNIYTTSVIDKQPVGKGQKLFDSAKSKDVAKWVCAGHHERWYS